jgi:hypothetical protein
MWSSLTLGYCSRVTGKPGLIVRPSDWYRQAHVPLVNRSFPEADFPVPIRSVPSGLQIVDYPSRTSFFISQNPVHRPADFAHTGGVEKLLNDRPPKAHSVMSPTLESRNLISLEILE